MKIKVNPEKLKNRLKEQQEKAAASASDPKESIIVKATEAGDLHFRAVPYPHSADPTSEPFAERHYHFIRGIGYVYCPSKNDGEKCHLCEFIWDRAKATKGTPAAKEWLKCLPTMNVLIPGIIRGREDEGPKFFKITTRQDKPSEKYNQIYGWFMEADTEDWMDCDKGDAGGFDMILKYGEPDAEQAKFLKLRKGSVMLKGIDLARKSSVFGKKGEFEDFLEKIPDIDTIEPFLKRTTEDTLKFLQKWNEILKKKAPPKTEAELNSNEGITASGESEPEKSSEEDSGDDLTEKLASMGL